VTSTVGVLALQGDFAEHAAVLTHLQRPWRYVTQVQHLHGVAALIIPGGESTTMARLMTDLDLVVTLQTRIRDGMAVLGTCAGAILLARQVDHLSQGLQVMDIAVQRNAFGRQVDSFTATIAAPTISPAPIHAVFIRAPRILSAGPNVDILARLDDGSIVAARERNLLAITFHPELTRSTAFHEFFLSLS